MRINIDQNQFSNFVVLALQQETCPVEPSPTDDHSKTTWLVEVQAKRPKLPNGNLQRSEIMVVRLQVDPSSRLHVREGDLVSFKNLVLTEWISREGDQRVEVSADEVYRLTAV